MAIWIKKDKLTTDLCESCQNCKNNEPCENCEVMAVIEEQPETWWTFEHGPVKILVDIRGLSTILAENCCEGTKAKCCEECERSEECELWNAVCDLPMVSAGSGIPVGEWTYYRDESRPPPLRSRWKCSACNKDNLSYGYDFCPNCGAKMKNPWGKKV